MHWLKELKKRLFPMQLTKRIYLLVTALIVIPVTITSVLISVQLVRAREAHRAEQLLFVASSLEERLLFSYAEILEQSQALGKAPEEQALVLNQALQPIIDEFSRYYPEMGLGYYSIDLDRVVAVGPDFKAEFLKAISHDYEYFKLYQSGRSEVVHTRSSEFRGGEPLLIAAVPIYRNGRIIGHTWANIRVKDIYEDMWYAVWKIVAIGLLVLLVSLFICWRLFSWFSQGLQRFADALAHDTYNPKDKLLPEFNPILEVVKRHTDDLIVAYAKLQEEVAEREATEMELRQSIEQIHRSEERFVKVFEASPSMMWLVRLDDWQIVDVNECFVEVSGWRRDEVIGKRSEDLGLWATATERLKIREMLREKGRVRNFEAVFMTKHGEARTLLVSGERIDLAAGNCALITMTDITERKQLEREMLRLDRLDLLGEMAAGISHEVRNPLTTIRGFLQMLKIKPECQSYNEYFDLMIEELDRANAIITEFLSIGRNKVVEQKVQSLNSIIEAIAPLIQADAFGQDKNLILELEDIPNLLLNEKEIRQLVLNLFRNALEAMKPGGMVKIKTYCEWQEVVLAVEDEGEGIPPEVLDRIGTPFFTTKEQGTGLGLPVCYSIAARHHARIMVNTSPAGTTFYVYFSMRDSI